MRDGGRDYRVLEFCCWEYPDDLSRGAFITEVTTRRTIDWWRKVLPIDVYLEVGAYAWSGTLNQPSGTFAERVARVRRESPADDQSRHLQAILRSPRSRIRDEAADPEGHVSDALIHLRRAVSSR